MADRSADGKVRKGKRAARKERRQREKDRIDDLETRIAALEAGIVKLAFSPGPITAAPRCAISLKIGDNPGDLAEAVNAIEWDLYALRITVDDMGNRIYEAMDAMEDRFHKQLAIHKDWIDGASQRRNCPDFWTGQY